MDDHYKVRRMLAYVDESYFGVHYMAYVIRMAKIHMHAIESMLLWMRGGGANAKVRRNYRAQHVFLKKLIKRSRVKMHKALCKPPVTFMRNPQWFFEGDGVYVRTDPNSCKWSYGVVTYVGVAKDGTRKITVSSTSSRRGVYTWSDPCIIKEWEYRYFQKNRLFFIVWQEMSRMHDVYGMAV